MTLIIFCSMDILMKHYRGSCTRFTFTLLQQYGPIVMVNGGEGYVFHWYCLLFLVLGVSYRHTRRMLFYNN